VMFSAQTGVADDTQNSLVRAAVVADAGA
jgi:hypothetical protein